MARRYTMTDVTTTGSSVQTFRSAMSESVISAGKGYSDDTRMRNMFPQSPLYQTGSSGLDLNGKMDDSAIIENFKTTVIDIEKQNNYDFLETAGDFAYMNAGFHPKSPNLDRQKLNKPNTEVDSHDKPYWGHANLQVSSIDPLAERTTSSDSDGGLLRERTAEDGGFGRKYKTNYATGRLDQDTVDATSTMVNIGQYFSKIYGVSSEPGTVALSKKNLLGSSRATTSNNNNPSSNDTGNPLQ